MQLSTCNKYSLENMFWEMVIRPPDNNANSLKLPFFQDCKNACPLCFLQDFNVSDFILLAQVFTP